MRVLATTIPLVIERHLIYCIYPSFKLMVYWKNDASLTYSHVFWNLYDFSIEYKRIFSRMSKLLFSIQWKWIVSSFSVNKGLDFSLFLTQSWHKTTFKVYFFLRLAVFGPHPFSLCGEEQHEHSAKHLFFCFTQKRKTYGFGRTWWWVNDVRFSMFG